MNDNYDDYYEKDTPLNGDACYCRTMMLCSNCMKGYK